MKAPARARTLSLSTLLLLASAPCWAGDLSPDLAQIVQKGKTDRVQVVLETSGRPQPGLIAQALAAGAKGVHSFTSINAVTLNVPVKALAGIAHRADVSYVVPDRALG